LAGASRPAGNTDEPRPGSRLAARPSFDQLVAEHRGYVARLCYRLLGWRCDVEDVVQDVFVAALRGLPRFRHESSLATWLTRLTINACRSHGRRRRLRLRLWLETPGRRPPRPDQPAGAGLANAERIERIRQAVRRLPQKYREVVVLRYLEELSVPEVAAVLSLAPNAVEVRLSRGRKRLKESLAELME
jgi:RNA polymerase sigma-70 factor (ECF subfamily)